MAGLARQLIQAAEGVIDLADDFVERLLRNRRVATVAVELGLVPLQLLEQVGLQVGT